MIYELADILVIAGREDAFEAGVAAAAQHFRAAAGCRSLELRRGVEHPSRYQLVVGWNTLEDHTVQFRQSEGFQAWRRLVGGCFAEPPQVRHVEVVLEAF